MKPCVALLLAVTSALLSAGCTTLRVDSDPTNAIWVLTSGIVGASGRDVDIPDSIFKGRSKLNEELVVFRSGYEEGRVRVELVRGKPKHVAIILKKITTPMPPSIAFLSDPPRAGVHWVEDDRFLGYTPLVTNNPGIEEGDRIRWTMSDYKSETTTFKSGQWVYEVSLDTLAAVSQVGAVASDNP